MGGASKTGPMRIRLVALLLIAAQLLLASCDRSTSRPAAAPEPTPAHHHRGYYIDLPVKATKPSIDSTGGAVVNATSNLPEGTIAYITTEVGGADYYGGAPILRRIVAGTLKLRQPNYCAGGPDRDLIKHGFDIHVVVVPDLSLVLTNHGGTCRSLADCGVGPLQPRSVQRILGSNFERLTGDSVLAFFGSRAIVADAHYTWPGDECPFSRDFEAGAPRSCEPANKGLNEDEGGVNLEDVAQSVTMLLGHYRACDLYSFTTERFRRTVTWSELRERVRRWPKLPESKSMYGVIYGKGPNSVGVLDSPTFLEVRYVLYGKNIARARFVARASQSGYTKWQIEALDLYGSPKPA